MVAGLADAAPATADGGSDGSGNADVTVVGEGGTPNAGALPQATQGPGGRMTPQAKPAPQASALRKPSDFPVQGIDVASHQGNVNWAKVKGAGARFVYVKATEGTSYYNPYFDQQYGGAKAHGLYAGAYVFARPDGNARAQARYFYDHAQYLRDGKTLPLMLDLEGPYPGTGVKDLCWNRKPASMINWINTFVTTIGHRSGSPMLIYTNNWWWSQCTGDSGKFGGDYLNTAYWSSTEPTTLPGSWTRWTVWQYTGSGSIAGVSGAVDRDVFNGSMAKLRRWADPPSAKGQKLIPNDFNLDGHTNPGVFRNKAGNWAMLRDTGRTSQHFGTDGDIPLTWNSGDGWAKMAVFRPSTGTWYLANHVGSTKYQVKYGKQGDVPVPAHYSGIGTSTVLAVFRPSTSDWYLRGIGKIHYGTSGDTPVPGRYKRTAAQKDTIAVFRPKSGAWYIRGVGKYQYGKRGDIPVPADYNGDGITNIAVYRPSNATWYIRGVGKYQYGTSTDVPVTGDFDGNGTADVAVFRPGTHTFHIRGQKQVLFAAATDMPIGKAPFNG